MAAVTCTPGNESTLSPEESLNVVYMKYMDFMMNNIFSILTPQQRTQYCLIFGQRVLASFDTLEEAHQAQRTTFSFLVTMLYVPK